MQLKPIHCCFLVAVSASIASAEVIGRVQVIAEETFVWKAQKKIARLVKGHELEVTARRGTWLGVQPWNGWIRAQDVRFISPKTEVVRVDPDARMVIQKGLVGNAKTIDFSSDEKLIVTTGGRVILWDYESGTELYRIAGYQASISPDGKKLAILNAKKGRARAQIIELANGVVESEIVANSTDRNIDEGEFFIKIVYADDGACWLVSETYSKINNCLRVIDVQRGEVLFSKQKLKRIAHVDLAKNGRLLIYDRPAHAGVWDFTTDSLLCRIPFVEQISGFGLRLVGAGRAVSALVRKRSSPGRDKVDIVLRNSRSGAILYESKHDNHLEAESLSSDGHCLALGYNRNFQFVDLRTGKRSALFKYMDWNKSVLSTATPHWALAFNSDASRLASARRQDLTFYDVAGKAERTFPGRIAPITDLSITPEGLLAIGTEVCSSVWDLHSGRPIVTIDQGSDLLQVTSDFLFSWQGLRGSLKGAFKLTKRILPATPKQATRPKQNEDLVSVPDSETEHSHSFGVIPRLIAICPAGRLALHQPNNQALEIRSLDRPTVEDGTAIQLESVGNLVSTEGVFNPTLPLVAAAGYKTDVFVWNTNTGKLSGRVLIDKSSNYKLRFSSTGQFLAISDHLEVKVFELNTFTEQMSFLVDKELNRRVNTITFSRDDRLVLLGDVNGRISIWDFATQKELFALAHDTLGINDLLIIPRTDFLVAASRDGSVRFWDFSARKLVATLTPLGRKEWVVTTPDGRFDASEEGTQLVRWVKGTEILDSSPFVKKFHTLGLLSQVLELGDAAETQ